MQRDAIVAVLLDQAHHLQLGQIADDRAVDLHDHVALDEPSAQAVAVHSNHHMPSHSVHLMVTKQVEQVQNKAIK